MQSPAHLTLETRVFAELALAGTLAVATLTTSVISTHVPADHPTLTLSPATVRAGDHVAVTLTGCPDPEAGARAEGQLVGDGTTAHTPVEPVDLKPTGPDSHTLTGEAVVTADVKPHSGTHTVYAACAAAPDDPVGFDLHT
ncbi:hypothetical protein G3I40_12385 [Streptomyces sp. SID14478]|uniref:hypothetical protein n=1 Tax=Streptomyces sp. SID14478 TaxID=2706073 RepID=UPI0013DA71F0|nr:hypothetical protein [Streptomyces sp. SID14478]NEB76013.1 hypothetical protein [Streptomyces sp. SID14478]